MLLVQLSLDGQAPAFAREQLQSPAVTHAAKGTEEEVSGMEKGGMLGAMLGGGEIDEYLPGWRIERNMQVSINFLREEVSPLLQGSRQVARRWAWHPDPNLLPFPECCLRKHSSW